MRIKRCKTLTAEQWSDVADRLQDAAPIFAGILEKINRDGKGQQDARELMADMQCAVTAVRYVSAFAADQCNFLLVSE